MKMGFTRPITLNGEININTSNMSNVNY